MKCLPVPPSPEGAPLTRTELVNTMWPEAVRVIRRLRATVHQAFWDGKLEAAEYLRALAACQTAVLELMKSCPSLFQAEPGKPS